MIQLYYFPGNASMAVHTVLLELGVPFDKHLVDRANNEHKGAAYLKLNPNGLIPVLVDGDLVLYETAAICMHLADAHSAAGLAPPLGTPERGHYYKWMLWLSNTLQATLIHFFYPHRLVDEGNAEGTAQVQAHAQARIGEMLDQLAAQLASHGGPWLLGERYSVADPLAFMLCRWTRGFSGPTAAPARSRPALAAYLERMLARPAVQRMLADEGLQPPWV